MKLGLLLMILVRGNEEQETIRLLNSRNEERGCLQCNYSALSQKKPEHVLWQVGER